MSKETGWVVYCQATGLYLKDYCIGNPPASIFGALDDALDLTQAQAESIAPLIGHGVVGTRRP